VRRLVVIVPRIVVFGDYADVVDIGGVTLSVFQWLRIGDECSPLIGELLDRMETRSVSIWIELSYDEGSDTSHMLERRGLSKTGEIGPRAIDDRDEAIRQAWGDGLWDYLQCEVTVAVLGKSIFVDRHAEYRRIEWSSIGELIWDDPNFEIHLLERLINCILEPLQQATVAAGGLLPEGAGEHVTSDVPTA